MSGARTESSPPATVAGRYEVARVIGRGGMGVVYEATHAWTGRRVALKLLRAEYVGDESAMARFRREAHAGVQSAHPHIVDVLDMGVDEQGALYLAQELLVGEDLAARLARLGRRPLREAAEALIPAMDALETAHRAGVVHRDVKPANIFLARSPRGDEVPKIIDFGVASVADAASVTRTGAPLGTPQYMAPEQARGERDVDARADVWAMGVVWFEALTGRRPIEGANYHEVMARLLLHPDLRANVDEVPEGLRAPIERALVADRAGRHPDMATFARALLAAPEIADTPWGVALASRHRFDTTAPPRAEEPPTAAAPVTLDLPPASRAPTVTPPAAVTPPALVRTSPRHAAVSSRGSWIAAVVVIALVAVGWALRPASSPSPSARPVAVTRADAAAPPVLSTPSPVVAAGPDAGVVGGSFAPERSQPPRAAPPLRPRRQPASMRRDDPASAVNGAPVLEP